MEAGTLETTEPPSETGLSNIQIQTIFSLKQFYSRMLSEEHITELSSDADTDCSSSPRIVLRSSTPSHDEDSSEDIKISQEQEDTCVTEHLTAATRKMTANIEREEVVSDSTECSDSYSSVLPTIIKTVSLSQTEHQSPRTSSPLQMTEEIESALNNINIPIMNPVDDKEIICQVDNEDEGPSSTASAGMWAPDTPDSGSGHYLMSSESESIHLWLSPDSEQLLLSPGSDSKQLLLSSESDSMHLWLSRDSDSKPLSCVYCTSTFLEEGHLKAHITKEHPNGSVEVISLINVPNQTLSCHTAGTIHDIEDHLKYNILKRVHDSTQTSEIQTQNKILKLANTTTVKRPSDVCVQPQESLGVSSQPCRTCGITFTSSDAFHKHTRSCFRVWSSAAQRQPQQISSTRTQGKRIAKRQHTSAHNEPANIFHEPNRIKLRKNSTKDSDNLWNKEKVEMPPFLFSKLINPKCKPSTSDNEISKSSSASDLSKSEINCRGESLDRGELEEVSFPQPIEVHPIVKLEAEELQPGQAPYEFTHVVKMEPVEDTTPAPRPFTRCMPSRSQLYQLRLQPRVKLTRCDDLLTAQGTYMVSQPVRCAHCALEFSCVLRLAAHARVHLWPCCLCHTQYATRELRTSHARMHRAQIASIIGVRFSVRRKS